MESQSYWNDGLGDIIVCSQEDSENANWNGI